MSKNKSPKKASSKYIETIRDGAVAANIFRGNTADGHTYLYFELSRSWKTTTGNREGYSKRFYERNSDALCTVIQQAQRWIEQNPEAADGPLNESAPVQQPQAA